MLGTRTKQINAYGRRGHRIVNANDAQRLHVSHDAPTSLEDVDDAELPMAQAQGQSKWTDSRNVLSSSPSPRAHYVQKKLPAYKRVKRNTLHSRQEDCVDISPVNRQAKPGPSKRITEPLAIRHPLGVLPANLVSSPFPMKKTKHGHTKALPLKTRSPVVQVEIVTFDKSGQRVNQERRVSRSDIQTNPLHMAKRPEVGQRANTFTVTAPIVITDGEDDFPINGRPKHFSSTRAAPIIISSDDSESDPETTPPIRAPRFSRKNIVVSPPISNDSSPAPITHDSPELEVKRTTAPKSHVSLEYLSMLQYPVIQPLRRKPDPSRSKPRQLTPIRNRINRSAAFPAPPSPPSPTTPTDFDLSLSLGLTDLALSSAVHRSLHAFEKPPPPYLQPLLQECSQTTPHEFSAFIDMFPFDPMTRSTYESEGLAQFQKIGEASFSEVFGIGDVVLKVIPLRDEDVPPVDDFEDFPAPSDAKDVLKEIIVTRAMGETCEGFVKLLRTYIVRGKYPSLLLDLWDEYHERKGSESVRPDGFSVSQVYAIIVLPNGGPDLEAYSFSSSPPTRWRRACSIFWQVTRSLAEAEDLVRFEHRDLHWGQILVKSVSTPSKRPNAEKRSMDHLCHGVQATVIDLGLARMDADDSDPSHTRWTPFEPEIFEGEGDYQFDVYRMMKVCNKDQWETYHPLTNVMWLHYLVLKLLHAKRLRAPTASRKLTSSATFSELECYQCLVEVEAALAGAVAACKPPGQRKKSRRKTQVVQKATPSAGPQSASGVLKLGVDRGWITPSPWSDE